MSDPIPQTPMDRLLHAYGLDRDARLIERLGIAQSTVSTWRTTGRVPKVVLLTAHLQTGYSPVWIQTGEGDPQAPVTLDAPAPVPRPRHAPARRAPSPVPDAPPPPAHPAPRLEGEFALSTAREILAALTGPADTRVRLTLF